MLARKLGIYMEKMNFKPFLTIIKNLNWRWIIELNLKLKIHKASRRKYKRKISLPLCG